MGTYRLEEASTGRAGCQNKECKDQKVKIQKGELRVGTWIENEKFQSFAWRHWGCVTPKMLSNMAQSLEDGGMEAKDIDGFEELPDDVQEKVIRAVEQGHVDDEDWNGDAELNRPGKNGFRVRVSKKQKEEKEEKKEMEEDLPVKKNEKKPAKSKKRGAKADEEEGEEEGAPTAKKAKKGSRAKKNASEEPDEPAKEKPAAGGRKTRARKQKQSYVETEGEEE